MKKHIVLTAALYLVCLIFTRTYNLSHTAQFAEDESGFLVRAHQIYKEKKITLVGQVNQFGTKVFSSLTVYLLLPFAVAGKFDPISIFYGAAFYGVVTVVLLLYLTYKINKPLLPLAAILLLFFYPLVRTGRWAWNPNLIPFWIGLGVLFSLQKKVFWYFVAGVCFGLSVHQHYFAVFAALTFIFLVSLQNLKGKKFKEIIAINSGFAFALLPFIIFDLRHPPGIFLLGASAQGQAFSITRLFENFPTYTFETAKFYTQNQTLAIILIISLAALVFWDLLKKRQTSLYFIPVIFQIVAISALTQYFPHYFFAIIPFFILWLIHPRGGFGKAFSTLAIVILIVGGVFSLKAQLRVSPVEPNLATFKKIDSILKEAIINRDLKNVNIAVLSSSDPSTNALKYRNLLLVPDNVSVATHDEYFSSDFLFVISTANEENLRHDPALELKNFRNGLLLESWQITPGPWRVYLFSKNI